MAGYGSDQGFTDYTAAAGYTVPSGTVAAARQRGSVYIDGTYGWRFPGVPTDGLAQDRAWPRTGAIDWYGAAIDPSLIPVCVINASYEAAYLEMTKPGSLSVISSSAKTVAKLKAGSVEIDYAGSAGATVASSVPFSTLIEGMLMPVTGPVNFASVLIV
jgi:hypothetical protein